MTFNWDDKKNELLRNTRQISFEEIVVAIEEGHVVDVLEHPNRDRYANQEIYLIAYRGYVYVVPFVRDASHDQIFLKTIYPSRRFTKLYRQPEEPYDETNE